MSIDNNFNKYFLSLPINNVIINYEFLLSYLQIMKFDSGNVINVKRFTELINNILDFISSEIINFNSEFMNLYIGNIKFEYLMTRPDVGILNPKISKLSEYYIEELSLSICDKIQNNDVIKIQKSLEFLKEDTIELRNNLNYQISQNKQAIKELSSIK
jgi:hypothetical protein